MIVGYVRVSTIEQHEDRQVRALEERNVEKLFIDKKSGKDLKREELEKCLEFIRDGDTLVVLSFDRLARSTQDLLCIVELLKEKGVTLISLKENIDTSTPTGKLMLTLIAAISEFERSNLLERQKEGIACAKERGVYKGRQKKTIHNFDEWYAKYKRREINKVQLARSIGVSRPTLDKMIKEIEPMF